MAGIPIRSTPGVGGGFEIMPEYKVNNKVFSTNDLSTLLIGLSGLSNMMHEADLIHTLTKIKSFIPTDKAIRFVEPYQLILKSNHWYFQGYCHTRNDYRLFRLSRMT